MKDLIKISIIASIMGIPNTLGAAQEIDETLKNQCKYILYGNLQGSNNDQADGYLLGFIQGVEYLTARTDLTEFFTSRNYRMVKERACENALKKGTEKGFQADYQLEAYKLISIKAEKPKTDSL
jgi:hypothetical protein